MDGNVAIVMELIMLIRSSHALHRGRTHARVRPRRHARSVCVRTRLTRTERELRESCERAARERER